MIHQKHNFPTCAGAIAFAALALVSPVLAQDAAPLNEADRVLTTEMSGFEVTLPAPYWTGADLETPVLEQTRPLVSELRPGITSVVFNKKDENSVLWTELMGVLAVAIPGYTAGLQFRNIAEPLAARCMPGQLELIWVVPLPGTDREALVGMCGRYNLETQTGQSCAAGLIAAVSVEKPAGVVSAYHEWCTDAFDVKDPEKWPVRRQVIDAHARLLQANVDFTPLASGPQIPGEETDEQN